LPSVVQQHINKFDAPIIKASELLVRFSEKPVPVIHAIDGALITDKIMTNLPNLNGWTQMDRAHDIIKICVINRYQFSKPSVGFIHNFGLKGCAIASTVAHDSHNIIAVGDDEEWLVQAINILVASKGGLSAVSKDKSIHIPLPIAGLMSDQPVLQIGHLYSEISAFAKKHGCQLTSPFMTLSFMALLVIPKIKISDMGMFDAEKFEFY